jgi:hypothetical protein
LCYPNIIPSAARPEKNPEKGLLPGSFRIARVFVQFFEKVHERSSGMDWSARNRTNHRLPFLLERFHLAHVFHDGLAWERVRSIDQRPAKYVRKFGRSNTEIVDYHKNNKIRLYVFCPEQSWRD